MVRKGWDAAMLVLLSACSTGQVANGAADASGGDAAGHGDAAPLRDAGQPSADADADDDSDAEGAAVLVSIAVTPVSESTCVGSPPTQYKAVGAWSDGSAADLTRTATWSSSDPSIAVIDAATGLATPGQAGTATISATLGAVAGKTTITVSACGLLSIAVSPSDPTIDVGCTDKMTATGTYSDGSTQDVSMTSTWSSQKTAIVTVDDQGYVTCREAGTTEVSATMMGVTGNTILTCTAGTITSVSVSPPSGNVPVGGTQTFAASGTSTSGVTCNLSVSATWQSSNTAVATTGMGNPLGATATGVGAGTATITASYGGSASGSATLTVQ